jgi:ferric-dicitrate binding protein FerR (iron transport regulator)
MESSYSDIDLAKYFSGECSAEERIRIEAWSNESDENKELFRAAEFVWERSKLADDTNYDTDNALSKVHSKLKFEAKPAKKYLNYYKIAAIAAVILLPVLVLVLRTSSRSAAIAYSEITSAEEVKHVKLEDGSEVWLNRNSRLSVPAAHKGDEFKLKLEGEAYFQVVHNASRVFVVESSAATIKVLGTAFNFRAVKDEAQNVLSVTDGKVLCANISSKEEKIVEKGTQAQISLSKTIVTRKLEDANFLSWKTKILKFRETPFLDVAKSLEDYYNVNIEIDDSSLLHLPITTTIENASLNEVVDRLKMATDEIEIRKTTGGYLVTRKNE